MVSLPRPIPCQVATSCDTSDDFNFSPQPLNPSRPRLAVPDNFSDTFYSAIPFFDRSPISSSSSPSTLDDDSLPSPPSGSPNYQYVNCGSAISFGSPAESSTTDMYENSDPPCGFTTTSSPSNLFHLPPPGPSSNYSIASVTDIRESDPPASFHSDSPSPRDVQSSASFFYSSAGPPSQDRLPSLSSSLQADPGQALTHSSHLLADRDPHNPYVLRAPSFSSPAPQSHPSGHDRRMSEPAILSSPDTYTSNLADENASSASSTNRYPYSNPTSAGMGSYNATSRSTYLPPLHRGSSIGSIREMRHLEHSRSASFSGGEPLESPLSPFQGGFAGGSPLVQYGVVEDQYGTSPSETGFPSPDDDARTPSIPPVDRPGRTRSSTDPSSKTYSFVALPGNAIKKRPRRRYDEIERLYHCSWPDCNKAYGTLNHLNAHVTMQKHGNKRSPNEFKELRKQWRKAKKDSEAAANAAARRSSMSMLGDEHDFYDAQQYSPPPQRFAFPGPQSLPSSIPISPRYGLTSTEDYYASSDRSERAVDYTSLSARPRYGETGTSSSPWGQGLTSSTRSSLPSISLPSSSYYGGHLDTAPFQSGASSDRFSIPPPQMMMTGRLPQSSTLLTPLAGFDSRESTLPPLQMGGNMTYDPESYYDEGSGRRSGSGPGRTRVDDF